MPEHENNQNWSLEDIEGMTKKTVPKDDFQNSTDPQVWAKAFIDHKIECGWSLDDIDEGLMIGWFANAMERAHFSTKWTVPDWTIVDFPDWEDVAPPAAVETLVKLCHDKAKSRGWWSDKDGKPVKRNVGELLMLVTSELGEAMEAHRKDAMDNHLPDRKGLEVELADAIIRICDMAGGLGLDLPGAFRDKMKFNQERADHKPENRFAPGGKKV